MDNLKCQICDEIVNNNNHDLFEHLNNHIGDIEDEAERENQDVEVWVLSYFDSIE